MDTLKNNNVDPAGVETNGKQVVDTHWDWASPQFISDDKKDAWIVDKQLWNANGQVTDVISRSFEDKVRNPATPKAGDLKDSKWSYSWSSKALKVVEPNGIVHVGPGKGTFSGVNGIQGVPF